jgi:hypothetical protein
MLEMNLQFTRALGHINILPATNHTSLGLVFLFRASDYIIYEVEVPKLGCSVGGGTSQCVYIIQNF